MLAFISHNKNDRLQAQEIAMYLAAEGVNVWYDEWEIDIGDSIVSGINDGLRLCSHFVLVWSANAAASRWVTRESESTLAQCLATGRPRIIPIVLDCTPMPSLLSDLKYLRFEGGTERDREEIVRAIIHRNPTDNFIRAVVKKYHEVVYGSDKGDLNACPQCGSTRVRIREYADYENETHRVIASCEECKWGELWA